MGGPLYAAEGDPIDDTEVLKQMIMDEMMQSQSQEGRTLSDKDEKMYRDYQPEYEGLPEDYKSMMDDSWFGKLRKFIPDAFQVQEWLADKKGFPSVSDLDADALRQYKELRGIERGMEGDLAGRRQELRDQVDPFEQQSESQRSWRYKGLPDRDRTISEMISDEELRNEMRILEREEPSAERERLLEEMRERAANYRSR